ncbi:hypothetical protein M23134_06416 [Microscilla marina ATCC 23134]|uniref:Uncharacterized protein n=2 Tax=Microscilla marina TaxID=1027 RepID=A1ZU96_MICM2|nr:hypothetical protein M23134_06416 [Microscilla marina ATCC 23134]
MKELNIKARPNYQKDSKIVYEKFPSYDGLAGFEVIYDNVQQQNNPDLMFYIDPRIIFKPELEKELKVFEDTPKNVKARSVLVHEYTHLLQWGTYEELHLKHDYISHEVDFEMYVSQRIEFEAWATQAWYYLEHMALQELNDILELGLAEQETRKQLINRFCVLDGGKPIFKLV